MNRKNIIQKRYDIAKDYFRQKSTIGKTKIVGVNLRL